LPRSLNAPTLAFAAV
jgi:hypothetical protein